MYEDSSINFEPKGRLEEKLYSRSEFAELLLKAADEAVKFAKKLCPDALLPEKLLFLVPCNDGKEIWDKSSKQITVTPNMIHDANGAAKVLVSDDGWHLSDTHLSVRGVSDNSTFILVEWSIYGWTNMVLFDHPLFQSPPFIIAGPVLDDYDFETRKGTPTIYRIEIATQGE